MIHQKNLEYTQGLDKIYSTDLELPKLIDSSYPYISIYDLQEVANIFAPEMLPEDIAKLEDSLQTIKEMFAPNNCTFYKVSSLNLARHLERIAEYEASRNDKSVGIVHMDRHIGKQQVGAGFMRRYL